MSKAVYKFDKKVANYLEEGIKGGVLVKDMLAGMQDKFQQAPRSHAMLYKIYGSFMADVKSQRVAQVGDLVFQQATKGHFPSQELFLRAKGGWSPQNTVNEHEVLGDEDVDSGPIDVLLAKLGKTPSETDEEE